MIPRTARVPIPPPPPVSLSRLLLVEGDTPMHFFEAWLQHLGLEKGIEVRNFRGVGDLNAYVMDLAGTAEFQTVVTSVGIVRDAESDATAARQAVEGALQAAGLTPARVPLIKTSIFILPDNASPGMIETLCMRAVTNDLALADPVTCVEEFFVCLQKRNVSVPATVGLAKHHAQAYLATRVKLTPFVGLAAYRDKSHPGAWPWDNPVFNPLRLFLQSL